ncbi:SET domain-containing protein [Nonomuraea sp. H19]|uniref:SET domain-containing protein n=1 Tax=Nonomuraea sp. H19 TaxID=3452206 RepID=UPI003F8A1FDE
MRNSHFPAGSRLTPSAQVNPSAIEGQGLFATTPLDAGEIVIRLGGQLIDDATLATLTPPYSSLTVDDGRHLLLDPAHPVRYGNHSCDPNLLHTDAITIVARRPISPGEELTIDYATHTGIESWTMTCRCGTALCRGTVTGRDWRLPHLRRAYGDHWSPPLLRRIRADLQGPSTP